MIFPFNAIFILRKINNAAENLGNEKFTQRKMRNFDLHTLWLIYVLVNDFLLLTFASHKHPLNATIVISLRKSLSIYERQAPKYLCIRKNF